MSKGTSLSSGSCAKAKAASGSMNRRMSHAEDRRSMLGRGLVTQRRF
jgi:hypothetical protein